MTKADTAALKKLLSSFKSEYKKSFPEKVKILRHLHKQNNLSLLKDELHKLKGTGKTYGYPEVSQLCEALEALCEPTSAKNFDKAWNIFDKMIKTWQRDSHYELSQDEDAQYFLNLFLK